MAPQPTTTKAVSSTIGALCIGGDWALAHGDFETLGYLATQLAAYASEPLHCSLLDLSSACISDVDRASQLWDEMKTRLFREVRA